LRNKKEIGRSRQQKKPIPSKDVSWQDLTLPQKTVEALNSEKLFPSSHQKE
jgi:hypothetical protein